MFSRGVILAPVEKNSDLKFLPGQWLDTYTPISPKAGGFTITSAPSSLSQPNPYIELAIQRTSNPPAKYLHLPQPQLLNTLLQIRVGGSFTYPPTPPRNFKRVVFVAGGVGVNPLMSMLSHIKTLKESGEGDVEVRFLYSVKEQRRWDEILFFERIKSTMAELGMRGGFKLFLTPGKVGSDQSSDGSNPDGVDVARRRLTHGDLHEALGPVAERKEVLCYVCGVPRMTDEYVKVAKEAEGMMKQNVFCESWW
ncbi:putative Oxidoreductase NAD-binding domain-containing protein 1 [Glarea lozoyensis 74030]|uniref:Putative Oxidoreductase NAD-binding domain-containing protein 1 n=1 Tax=Glarea lozoyensis (strain ATCC 74030 / MF5533) TaxID=1104152 RepID=H0EWU8_GLAL7|nr:putative Oxidoreductase NAD-binding domain-containing protein 1 [Glarea lozoyensis 74030]